MGWLKTDDAWTGEDKKLHFIAGAAVAGVASLVAAQVLKPTAAAVVGLVVCVVVAVAKEVYDHFHPDVHTASWQDAAVTAIGGIAGSAVAHLILK